MGDEGNNNMNSPAPEQTTPPADKPVETPEKGTTETGAKETGKEDSGTALGSAREGAPETYDFTSSLPEGATLDETVAGEFGNLCKGMNLTNEQANQIASFGYKFAAGVKEAAEAAQDARVKQWGDDMQKALGDKYDSTLSLAARGRDYMEREYPGINKALNETGAGNRLEIVQAFAKLGALIKEDNGPEAGSSAPAGSSIYNHTDFSKY